MSGVNRVFLVGHAGKDPEFRLLENEVPVVSFPLATTEILVKKSERVEQTEWHNIVMWRGLAEGAKRAIRKGQLVSIEGKVQTRVFIDKDGIKRYTTEIIANHFVTLGS